MPYLPTAQSFLEQSTLLISARPTTARITTKYTILKPPPPKSESLPSQQTQSQPQPPKATLTLKTYDPVSGTCLKYQTDKAAEVGRLVASLGICGRVMAALPAKEEAEKAPDEAEVANAVKAEGDVKGSKGGAGVKEVKGASAQGKGGEKGGGGGGGGKKKKGKK